MVRSRHFGEGNFCVGADATPALFAWEMGQRGFAGMKLDPTPEGVPPGLVRSMGVKRWVAARKCIFRMGMRPLPDC